MFEHVINTHCTCSVRSGGKVSSRETSLVGVMSGQSLKSNRIMAVLPFIDGHDGYICDFTDERGLTELKTER